MQILLRHNLKIYQNHILLDALRYFALALRKKWCACARARAQTKKIMRSICARDFF
jgi:hypothetical protein